MSLLTPDFSANRTVRQYTEQYYLPAAAAYHERAADHGAWGRSLLRWKSTLDRRWASVRFGELRVASSPHTHLLQVEVYMGELDADCVRVQLYADPTGAEPPFVSEMTHRDGAETSSRSRIYAGEVPASRPASHYTPRIVPSHWGASIPLEDTHILWFR
jgi:glycogen phosphorylase